MRELLTVGSEPRVNEAAFGGTRKIAIPLRNCCSSPCFNEATALRNGRLAQRYGTMNRQSIALFLHSMNRFFGYLGVPNFLLHLGIDFVKAETNGQLGHNELLTKNFPELFGALYVFALKRLPVLGERLDPEDFAQECLVEYARTAERHRWSAIQKPIIWTIARQRLIDCGRRAQREPKRQNLKLDALSVSGQPPFEDDSDIVTNAGDGLLGLTPVETERLRAKYLLGETYDSIARRENITPEGVRTAVRRAKRKLLARHDCGATANSPSAVA